MAAGKKSIQNIRNIIINVGYVAQRKIIVKVVFLIPGQLNI